MKLGPDLQSGSSFICKVKGRGGGQRSDPEVAWSCIENRGKLEPNALPVLGSIVDGPVDMVSVSGRAVEMMNFRAVPVVP